jgi:UPF0716 protein FxsA
LLRLFSLLFLAFICIPLAELALLLILGKYTWWWLPLLLVVVTAFFGAWLARVQGARTYLRIQEELQAGRMPAAALLDAALIFVAGVVLLTPGMLTDLFGFTLLVPLCRRIYRRGITRWFKSRIHVHAVYHGGAVPPDDGDRIIDSYVVDRDDPAGEKGDTESG